MLLSAWSAFAQQTQVQYLSGKGKDDTVDWQFYCTGGRNSGEWTTIPVPSNWELEGFGTYNYGHDLSNPDIEVGDEKGKYKYSFEVPESWSDKTVEIVFEGSMTDTEVWINGESAGPVHQGAFYRFKYDISDLLHYDSSNLLEVTVSKLSSNKSVNAAERDGDYWVFGGIFRPVYLQATPRKHIDRWAIDARADGQFNANVFVKNPAEADYLTGQITTLDGRKVGEPFRAEVQDGEEPTRISTKISNPEQWSPEFPNLYRVELSLRDEAGEVVHRVDDRFGFRTVELRKGDGFYVNGKKIRFRGVNRHSFWPESGRTMSKQLSIEDVNTMKDMNMNAVRMSHYPPDEHFLDVADSLGLFVIDELAGWHDAYDTKVGRKLVREMITDDVNHPSIVVWSNGNEGGNNDALDDDFAKYDPQDRPLIHPWDIFRGTDTQHYKDYNCCTNRLFHGDNVFFPTEFLHGLYDGGLGAGLKDYWSLMRSKPLSAGGFLWVYADECVERTDQNGRLDCDGNHAPDGIVGPHHEKEGSYFAIKKIWSPVHIQQTNITGQWNKTLRVENRYFYTNLNQLNFEWKLLDYPGPFEDADEGQIVASGRLHAPDVNPQSSGHLTFDLPKDWYDNDALRLTATDPHGRQIYTWSWQLESRKGEIEKVVEQQPTGRLKEEESSYVLSGGDASVRISKTTGHIVGIERGGKPLSLSGGPRLEGGKDSLAQISADGNEVDAKYGNDSFKVNYSLRQNGWLRIHYSYQPYGRYPYYGVSFDYPEAKVKGIKWLGDGPYRVWKNRLAGMEYGLWQKDYNDAITGHRWNYPEFKGYHADLNWAVLDTDEGPITMMVSSPGIYLGLFQPTMPPDPVNTAFKYPEGDLSFLHAISPIGTKFKKPDKLGPSGQDNIFQYPWSREGGYEYENTLWIYLGNR